MMSQVKRAWNIMSGFLLPCITMAAGMIPFRKPTTHNMVAANATKQSSGNTMANIVKHIAIGGMHYLRFFYTHRYASNFICIAVCFQHITSDAAWITCMASIVFKITCFLVSQLIVWITVPGYNRLKYDTAVKISNKSKNVWMKSATNSTSKFCAFPRRLTHPLADA